jgi:hypothetical protein
MSTPSELGRRLTRAFAGAALVLALAACASGGGKSLSGNPFAGAQGGEAEIRILVRNVNYNDANVWAVVRDARRERLGTVTGKSENTFTMRWSFTDALRLEFDLIGGVRCVTEALPVDPGEIIELQISVDPSQDPMCR